MIITIASGKGGTGKTTVATNLAATLGSKAQLLDCDVEEPNAHLFLPIEWEDKKTVTTVVPVVDEDKCTYCGQCGDVCQFKAIAPLESTVLTFPELCHSCGGCFIVCPEEAINEGTRELGVLEKGSFNGIQFAHGKLRVGEAMAPPLIKKVKEEIEPSKIALLDAPPGTSCPVIETMTGSDFVLLVTEPTPFGLHDLKLAVGAAKEVGIPCGIVINRCGIGDSSVGKYAENAQIPVLLKIPFDRKVAETYATGGLLVELLPSWKDMMKELYSKIVELMNVQFKTGKRE